MRKTYAVEGRLPSGKRFRGVVWSTVKGIVLAGPAALSGKPWHKRPLTIPELRGFANVEPCDPPRTTATIQQHLEHKFVLATKQSEIMARGILLQLAGDIRRRLEKENAQHQH